MKSKFKLIQYYQNNKGKIRSVHYGQRLQFARRVLEWKNKNKIGKTCEYYFVNAATHQDFHSYDRNLHAAHIGGFGLKVAAIANIQHIR